MGQRRTLALMLLAAMSGAASGCAPEGAGSSSDRQAPEAEELPAGRSFLSTLVTVGGARQSLAADSRIRLEFSGRKLHASAGCNQMRGSAELTGGTLTVTGLASTGVGCPQELMKQDKWLANFLTSGPDFQLAGDRLTLSTRDTVITMQDRETADPDRPLRGTRWEVTTLIEGNAASSVPAGASAHLVFSDDGTVSGNTGCNSLRARFETQDATITISEPAVTRMACDDARNQLERAVLGALEAELTFKITAGQLTLSASNGTGLQLRAS